MSKGNNGGKNYIALILYIIAGLGLFIGGIVTAFFGGVGLYFGQSVYEVDVLENKYKYECTTFNTTTNTCDVFDTTSEIDTYQDYKAFKEELNGQTTKYMQGFGIIFSLLGLVFLFMALREANLMKQKGNGRKDEY